MLCLLHAHQIHVCFCHHVWPCHNCQNITLPVFLLITTQDSKYAMSSMRCLTTGMAAEACVPASQGKASYSCVVSPTEEGKDTVEHRYYERQQQVSLPPILLLNSAETSNSTCRVQQIKQGSWHKGQLADTTPSRQRLQSQDAVNKMCSLLFDYNTTVGKVLQNTDQTVVRQAAISKADKQQNSEHRSVFPG
ncbi:TPA: hypothetical protein ACH3X1_009720 [Trebouxia sp. C0004]